MYMPSLPEERMDGRNEVEMKGRQERWMDGLIEGKEETLCC